MPTRYYGHVTVASGCVPRFELKKANIRPKKGSD